MKIDVAHVRALLKSFDFRSLFREQLGWDNYQAKLDIQLDDTAYSLAAIAEKRGFQVYTCPTIPDRPTRLKLDRQVTKSAREHLIIYTDASSKEQLWEWVRREPDRPAASRDYRFSAGQSGDALIQKLEALAIGLDEEEDLTIVDVTGKVKAALDVDKVTKRFYDCFKTEHAVFMKFIKGIKHDPDLQWYTSLMLNRLMFVYFIQKKGFLDGDLDYLGNRLARMQQQHGKDKFYSFYRYFLLRLFHEGLGQAAADRKADLDKLLGKVPFLDGGFFEVHDLEQKYPDINIPDAAFVKLFAFFDAYRWHLDERPLRSDNEINPDVVGYIFEKYVNQKQMGAYYTKEDITEYISKNTIIPFLFDAAERKCAIAFKPDSALWRLLRDDSDRYIYPAVRHGVIDDQGEVIQLPAEIAAGVTNVSKRDGWNKPAAQPFALPTETWREYVARRHRCLEIREKLRRGEVCQVNNLVTLNLDIWQFARDAIVNSEGPELLRAFYHTIAGRIPMRSNEKYERGLSMLDPTCGSGAFLFAALRILETLYADCLERMRGFLDELEHSGERHRPERYADFKAVSEETLKHPNERYFVLKSIIINNLFGVDIMEEAVEICKLRLFLKLVAQVERVEQIEPLPDIDFNIRAGNTLVGYVSLDEVRRSQAGTLAFGSEDIKQIEEDALIADGAYKRFRETQVRHGGSVTAKDKAELRKRLAKLDAQLDRYLAGEYGLKLDKPKEFDAWKASHQPFHWLVEFFGIMCEGGFDVIIGNPPYVELKEVNSYRIRGFACADCGNLYATVIERCFLLTPPSGRLGFIVPVSSISTDRYESLQKLLAQRNLHYSSYDDRPSRLFDGLEHIRLTIHIMGTTSKHPIHHSTRYNKWTTAQRPTLFQTLTFVAAQRMLVAGTMPKLCSLLEAGILQKLIAQRAQLSHFYGHQRGAQVFYSRKVGYFLQVLDFEPEVLDGRGQRRPPSEFKDLRFADPQHARLALACLNANLCYWFITVFSDCRHVNRREVDAFPVHLARLSDSPAAKRLFALGETLMKDLRRKSDRREMRFKHDALTVQCIIPKSSKPIIDELDSVMASYYGFSDEELDFIINYDIKYRMGGSEGGEEAE